MRGELRCHLLCSLLATVLLLAGVPAVWGFGEALRGPAPVDLSADALTYDQATQSYRAAGSVRVQKGELTLLADEIVFRAETEEADAIGNVRLTDPEALVEAERMELDLESGRGRLVDGRILLREHQFRVAGDVIERLGELDYRIERGTFTTCEGETPSWKFSARRLDVTVGGYARARHTVFYLRDIPVLYTPYFFYPVKTERESGFLMPRFGTSNRRGTQLSMAWYQVIARNQDATFHLDYLSRLGLGKGLEYRYIFGTDEAGEFNYYHVSGFSDEKDYSALDWRHVGRLPGDVRLTADIEWVSEREYFENFGEIAGEYNREKTESVVAFSKLWPYYTLGGQFRYTRNLVEDSDATLQRLPEIVFSAVRRPIGAGRFFFAFDSSATNFWRREGMTGQRMNLRPELSAIFHPGEVLEVRPALGYRERLYWTDDDASGFERQGIFDFNTRLSSRLSRVYDVEGRRVRRIQHSLQPEVLYTYVPQTDQNHLPQFDILDRIDPENRIEYALVNRLVARMGDPSEAASYHEFLYLRLSQSYDFRELPPDPLLPGERREAFSDVRAELIARPNQWSHLELETRFDVESRDNFLDRFFVLNVGGRIWSPAGNGLSLSYRYQENLVSYLAAGVDLALLRPVYLNYQHRHDFDAGRTLEKVLNLEYRSQCWSLFLTLRDRPEDTEYLISFALTGLGRVTGLGGRFGAAQP
jgi:LPS-assembly protein